MSPPVTAEAWQVGAHSERGARRSTNMDAVLVRAEAGVVVLADGMGSTRRGAEAAAMAVAAFGDGLAGVDGPAESDVEAAFAAAQDQVVEEFTGDGSLTGATTLCAIVAGRDGLLIVHVGDSRCHLLRDGVLTVLTTDHTVAAHLVSVGAAEPDSPLARRTANHLRRYVGNPAGTTADVIRHLAAPGDALLLSSDGLHGMLSTQQMADILRADDDPALAARRLVVAAAAAGGTDDATAVVVRPSG